MWMGGTVPLGYTAQDRKLIVNEPEAVTVRTIFNKFLHLGSVHSLQDWLRESDIRSRSGNHFFRGPLYTVLRNPHYLGLIKHKKESYPGEHPAIIAEQPGTRCRHCSTPTSEANAAKCAPPRKVFYWHSIRRHGYALHADTCQQERTPLSLLHLAGRHQEDRKEQRPGPYSSA
jgi:Recombinase